MLRKAKMTPSLCYNSVSRACMWVGGCVAGGAGVLQWKMMQSDTAMGVRCTLRGPRLPV